MAGAERRSGGTYVSNAVLSSRVPVWGSMLCSAVMVLQVRCSVVQARRCDGGSLQYSAGMMCSLAGMPLLVHYRAEQLQSDIVQCSAVHEGASMCKYTLRRDAGLMQECTGSERGGLCWYITGPINGAKQCCAGGCKYVQIRFFVHAIQC